eukprot:m.175517 g.175517  ORF g.175517 m.175517 type:complete len:78 (+) comp14613_c0_seq12:446-679(+)
MDHGLRHIHTRTNASVGEMSSAPPTERHARLSFALHSTKATMSSRLTFSTIPVAEIQAPLDHAAGPTCAVTVSALCN